MPMPAGEPDEPEDQEELAVALKPGGQEPLDSPEQPDQELEAARAFLREHSGKAPPAAHLRLGRACLASDRLDDARAAAKEALALSKEADDRAGMIAAQALLCDVHLQALEADEAIAVASKALAICEEVGDVRGAAMVLSKKAMALNSSGQAVESLRAAEKALKAWRKVGDPGGEAEALIVDIEAKLAICEERGAGKADGLNLTHLKSAQLAVRVAETWRARDHACLGAAFHVHARICCHLGNWKHTEKSARAAAKAFRKSRQVGKRAQALVLWAEADMQRGYLQDARSNAGRAADVFDRLGDQEGLAKVAAVFDGVDRALGIPTQAELEARRNQQMLMDQQQQYLLWQQQQQQQQGGQAPAAELQMIQPQMDSSVAPAGGARAGGGPVIVREGVALDLSAMVNQEAVVAKIMETVRALLADDDDDEDLDPEIPLMEAGMTSNNAVLMRDYLQRDMPGVNLPPTLIFDYPSVNSIAEFIVEKSLALQG